MLVLVLAVCVIWLTLPHFSKLIIHKSIQNFTNANKHPPPSISCCWTRNRNFLKVNFLFLMIRKKADGGCGSMFSLFLRSHIICCYSAPRYLAAGRGVMQQVRCSLLTAAAFTSIFICTAASQQNHKEIDSTDWSMD